ncbi:MAG: histidine phosphatase family protein [Firmicutes bacterium]|uniref:Histidine phosphatase family protein n=1 Tax=Sulfobacillus benefaciens TaxID=453960 RepID=A0A2T2WWB4_9FIRM|nr:histidine phosphatase family protein [Bacillota bacterium]MCL5014917.1 histidine phosphatase family protein [Bacillota bacterium]PSR26539.1 MAG: hypothetical protein C7B43_13770 [Sulfobacillus benefaciens]HBQ95702.1 hypothetical protein [Sulfobacillus sp.]
MPLSILLVRHGESEANIRNMIVSDRFDPRLTDRGRRDTEALAEKWQEKPIRAIYASPLARTMETARIWADQFHIGMVHSDDRLHEIHLGSFDGHIIDDLLQNQSQNYERWKADPESPPEGGEKLSAVWARLHEFLLTVCEHDDSGLIVGITHADCLKAVTLGILHSPWNSAQYLHFANVAGILVERVNTRFQLHALPIIPL